MTTEPTDAEILNLWESFVGEPTEEIPLSNSDKLCFARAALRSWGQPSGAVDWIGASSHHLIQQPTQAVPPAGREPLTEEQRSDIATAAAGFNWTDDYVEAIDYVIDGVESLHGIKGGQQ